MLCLVHQEKLLPKSKSSAFQDELKNGVGGVKCKLVLEIMQLYTIHYSSCSFAEHKVQPHAYVTTHQVNSSLTNETKVALYARRNSEKFFHQFMCIEACLNFSQSSLKFLH